MGVWGGGGGVGVWGTKTSRIQTVAVYSEGDKGRLTGSKGRRRNARNADYESII